MNKRTKVILLTFLGTLIVAILSLNATYSYMKSKTSGDKNTDVKVNSCAKISLKENSNTINLTNMYPMDDEMGLQTDAYDFTVSSTCDNYVGFDLYLTTYESEIDDGTIKFAITSKNDTVLASDILTSMPDGEKDLTDAEKNQLNSGVTKGYKKIYKVFTNNIPLKGESEYKLHIWLDSSKTENVPMNQSFKIGVSVKSFDRVESMAEYLINKKDDTLLYHNGTIKIDGQIMDAEDYSYRYSGGNDVVKNNYVCLDGVTTEGACQNGDMNLYRIIGLFKNDENLYEMKLIKAKEATKEQLGDSAIIGGAYIGQNNYYAFNNSLPNEEKNINSDMWEESNLNKMNLNNFYLNYLTSNVAGLVNHISNNIWVVGGISELGNAKVTYENELGKNKTTTNGNCYTQKSKTLIINTKRLCNQVNDLTYIAKIGLMYKSDYMYATTSNNWNESFLNYEIDKIIDNNWLYEGLVEWTISRTPRGTDSYVNRYKNYVWTSNSHTVTSDAVSVRPTFYITASTKVKNSIDTIGTMESPYRLDLS